MIPKSNVQEVLKKHLEIKPKLTAIFSILENGSITFDFSAPGTLGELLLIERIFKLELDKFVGQLRATSDLNPPNDRAH